MQSFSLPTQYFYNRNGNKISLECQGGKCIQCTTPYGYTNRVCDDKTSITNDINMINNIASDEHETKCFSDSNKTFTNICQYCNKKTGTDRMCTPFFRMKEDVVDSVKINSNSVPNTVIGDLRCNSNMTPNELKTNANKFYKHNTYPIDCVDNKCIYCNDDRPRHRNCTRYEDNKDVADKKLLSVEGFDGFGEISGRQVDYYWFLILLVLFIAVIFQCSKTQYF
jgi:hypothetical protein